MAFQLNQIVQDNEESPENSIVKVFDEDYKYYQATPNFHSEFYVNYSLLFRSSKPPVNRDTQNLILQSCAYNLDVFMVIMNKIMYKRGKNTQDIEYVKLNGAAPIVHASRFKFNFVNPFKQVVAVFRKVQEGETGFDINVPHYKQTVMLRTDLMILIDQTIMALGALRRRSEENVWPMINIWIELFDAACDYIDNCKNCHMVIFDDFQISVDDAIVAIENADPTNMMGFVYLTCPIFKKKHLKILSREFVYDRLTYWNLLNNSMLYETTPPDLNEA